jgi:hypothetical protein
MKKLYPIIVAVISTTFAIFLLSHVESKTGNLVRSSQETYRVINNSTLVIDSTNQVMYLEYEDVFGTTVKVSLNSEKE